MNKKELETQIQYKLIEKLTSINESLMLEISQRKQREIELENERKKLTELLSEKEILLRELTHRVKNNLQLIDSMLALQLSKNKDNDFDNFVQNYRARIHSIGIIHSLLSESEIHSQVDLKKYISVIAEGILGDIEITVDCPDFKFHFEKISSLGMILHELTTNSYKYAWKEHSLPVKRVFIGVVQKNNILFVKYSDNGNNGYDPKTMKPGFGIDLIEMLVFNQNIRYFISSNGGFEAHFEFEI